MEAWFEKVHQLADQVAQREGCELYDLEVIGTGANRVLRVFIDKANDGIGIEDCSNVSKGLNEFLDAEDIVPGGEYNLEVSSPGLDRRLKTEAHFQKVIGKKIAVQLAQNLGAFGIIDASMQAAKKFESELVGVESQQIIFNIKNEMIKVPITALEKAKLVFEFKNNKPPHKMQKSKKH